MSWSKTVPTSSTKVNQSDNLIRDNWAYLEDAISQEHEDPSAYPSTPSSIVQSKAARYYRNCGRAAH